MAIDIMVESTKSTPWGRLLSEALDLGFNCCYNTGDQKFAELIFHEPEHGLLMYVCSKGSNIYELRIFGDVANAPIERVKAFPSIQYVKEGDNYVFFEANPKDSFEGFIHEFVPSFSFYNPWHENLDHVRLCSPYEVGYPGATYPRIISGAKFDSCGPEVKKMIPNYQKTNWYSYN